MLERRTLAWQAIVIGGVTVASVLVGHIESTNGYLTKLQGYGGFPAMLADLLLNPAFSLVMAVAGVAAGVRALLADQGPSGDVRTAQMAQVERWREMIRAIRNEGDDDYSVREALEHHAEYLSLRSRLSQKVIAGIYGDSVLSGPARSEMHPFLFHLAGEIDRIEHEWGLSAKSPTQIPTVERGDVVTRTSGMVLLQWATPYEAELSVSGREAVEVTSVMLLQVRKRVGSNFADVAKFHRLPGLTLHGRTDVFPDSPVRFGILTRHRDGLKLSVQPEQFQINPKGMFDAGTWSLRVVVQYQMRTGQRAESSTELCFKWAGDTEEPKQHNCSGA